MNNARREAIRALSAEIQAAFEGVEGLMERVQFILEEEQDAFDAIPESLHGTDRAQASEAAIEALEEAVTVLEAIKDSVEECTTALETATA